MHPEPAVYFKDETVAHDYREYGFAVVEDFLHETEITELLQAMEAYKTALSETVGFSTSTDHNNSSFRMAMRDVINKIVDPEKTKSFFEGYTSFYSNLLIKKPDAKSEMVLHTDWSITDERHYTPLQIWIPLVDVNRQNGTLAVVPGSHRLTNIYRGCGIDENYMKYKTELLENYLHYFEVKKGTAVFYHPGILHYSPSNLSNDTRFALLVSFYPSAMQPVLYYRKKFSLRKKIEVYELTADFFNTWDKKSKPALKKINEVVQSSQGGENFMNALEMFRYEKGV